MTGTPIPTLFYGSAETAIVLQTNTTQLDNGDTIIALAKSNPAAPAGASGECIFKNVYVTVTFSMDVTIRFTPILDFLAFDGTERPADERISIVLAAATLGVRETKRFEIGLSVPTPDPPAAERHRNAMRGAWFQIGVDTPSGLDVSEPDGDLIFEDVELEYDVVRESVKAEVP